MNTNKSWTQIRVLMFFLTVWLSVFLDGADANTHRRRDHRRLDLIFGCSSASINTPLIEILTDGKAGVLYLSTQDRLGQNYLMKVTADRSNSSSSTNLNLGQGYLLFRGENIEVGIDEMNRRAEIVENGNLHFYCSPSPYSIVPIGKYKFMSARRFFKVIKQK